MATYVLVHGAWSGAHGFRRLKPFLREHDVTTPSLTGIGERVHLAGPQVDLSTHVRDLVNHVLYEGLEDIVLLGFSYGGFVVGGALHHIGARVRELVFLDAFVPRDGDSVYGVLGRDDDAPIGLGEPAELPPTPRRFDDPEEDAFQSPRRTPQPLGCFTERVRIPRAVEDWPCGRTYIRATAEEPATGGTAFQAAADHARTSSAWRYHEIATTHMVASNAPEELAAILLALA
jgi:pimeloyl-ACP methyl ester carboxylesterase